MNERRGERVHEVGLRAPGAPWVWGWRHLQTCPLKKQESVRICRVQRPQRPTPHAGLWAPAPHLLFLQAVRSRCWPSVSTRSHLSDSPAHAARGPTTKAGASLWRCLSRGHGASGWPNQGSGPGDNLWDAGSSPAVIGEMESQRWPLSSLSHGLKELQESLESVANWV